MLLSDVCDFSVWFVFVDDVIVDDVIDDVYWCDEVMWCDVMEVWGWVNVFDWFEMIEAARARGYGGDRD